METLASALEEIFRTRRLIEQSELAGALPPSESHAKSILAAEKWATQVHAAFYGARSTRGSNKFLALETTLTQVLTRLSDQDAPALWAFVVRVVLVLAHEPEAAPRAVDLQPKGAGRKSAKKCQPNAPLAFLVVNALKRLASGSDEQKELCRRQGETNEALRSFCTQGLGNSHDVVSYQRPLAGRDQKLLVEVVELFQISDIDSSLVRGALDQLLASKSHAALIKLCATFTEVVWPFDRIVKTMVQAKDWASAELFVRSFEAEGDADVLYSRDGLMRLIETQRWQLALTFVGHDATLQKVLLEHLVAAGELVHAAQLVKKMVASGLDPDISQMIRSQAEAKVTTQVPVTVQGHLELALEDKDVVFCDAELAIQEAMGHFFGSIAASDAEAAFNDDTQVVGLDVEWKPITSRSRSTSAVASILQIASSTRVFIIDLLALHVSKWAARNDGLSWDLWASNALVVCLFVQDNDLLFDGFLLPLFSSPKLLKVGFSFDSDMKGAGTDAMRYLKRAECGGTEIVWRIPGQRLIPDDHSYPGDAKQHVGELLSTSGLSENKQLEAVFQRTEYQKKWALRCTTESAERSQAPLMTPEDLLQIWEERRAAQGSENDATFNTALTFRPMDEIKASLEQPDDPSEPHNFVAVNSICIFADGEFTDAERVAGSSNVPCVACVDASCKLDIAKLAKLCGVGRRKIRLATAVECREVFGFAPGTVAPFGHRARAPSTTGEEPTSPLPIEIYADSRLQKPQYLAAGCGSQDQVLWVEAKAFITLIGLKLIDDISFARDPSRRQSPNTVEADGADSEVATSDESDQEPPILEYKFLADSMVAQVGRWLRTIGVDVAIWNPDDVPAMLGQDPKAVMLARATKEDRIVLTRDTQLPSRRDAGACFVLSDDVCYKQFREVKVQFGLLSRKDDCSSRCARCNSDAFSAADAAFVCSQTKERLRLRKKVLATVTKFWSCNGCGKLYWEGPKYSPSAAPSVKASADGSVVYRPVPRKRVTSAQHDQRRLPDPRPQ
ncbi:hypothetical protein BBJ28_00022682 [Nothophytophthora sp. Chile5]|nr:hypothetical protein BBJ28_00022682 [Nothophytophthora sp. Chile5]